MLILSKKEISFGLLFAVAHLSNIVCVFFDALKQFLHQTKVAWPFWTSGLSSCQVVSTRAAGQTSCSQARTRARTYRQVHANQARPSLVLMGFRLLWLYTNHMNLQAWGTPADTLHIRLRWKWYGALKLAQNCMHKSEEALLSWAEEVNGEKDVEWSKERDGECLKWIGEMKR